MGTQAVKISDKILNDVRKRVGKSGGTYQGFVEAATIAALNGAVHTDADLVSFGRFLYSEERKKLKKLSRKTNHTKCPLPDMMATISAEDLLNWKNKQSKS